MCRDAVENVQMPVIWKGKLQSLCAEAVEPTQRTEPAVEGSRVLGPVDPKDLATRPGAHPASRKGSPREATPLAFRKVVAVY